VAGNIAVVSQSLGGITAEMMQQMQQGLKVKTTREMHMHARLTNCKQFFVRGIAQEIQ
jgi:hypothetical protein